MMVGLILGCAALAKLVFDGAEYAKRCRDELRPLPMWTSHSLTCSPTATGTVVQVDGARWWQCTCPAEPSPAGAP